MNQQTSLIPMDGEIFNFALSLAAAGRIFIIPQVARHPHLSGRTQPEKRARDILSRFRDHFDVLPWMEGKPRLWRLTGAEKRRLGLRYKSVGASQHTEHWLAIGDVWMDLVFNGLRPSRWFTEGKAIGRFDVFADVQGQPYLIEVQNTPISKREWERKWHLRYEWLKLERWRESEWSQNFTNHLPHIVLVTTKPMDVLAPKGVIYAKSIDQLHHVLRPPHL